MLTEEDMKEIFQPMEEAIGNIVETFDRGHEKHKAARAVAPYWLIRWDDCTQWAVSFCRGWKGFVSTAKDFGFPLEQLLKHLTNFRDYHQNSKPLSEVEFSSLKVNDKLISATGKSGYISALFPDKDNSIEMTWMGEKHPSLAYHHQCHSVMFVGNTD